MKSALITGITGQDGSLMAEYLTSLGYRVSGIVRGQNNTKIPWIKSILPDICIIEADLLDQMSLIRAIEKSHPDEIYNFASLSNIPIGWVEAELMLNVTGLGVLRLIEAARMCKVPAKIFQAGSTEIFGHETSDVLTETSLINPKSPYAIAKLVGYNMARAYRSEYNMPISCAHSANHESFRRGYEFVTRKVCRAVAEIKLGLRESLILGNLKAYRDWGWAPDYIKYYHRMLQVPPDDFIVATGIPHTVGELVEIAFKSVGLNWSSFVVCSTENVNASTGIIPILLDNTKAKNKLGFSVDTPLETFIPMVVENEIKQLRDSK